jgi:hypothetical protein
MCAVSVNTTKCNRLYVYSGVIFTPLRHDVLHAVFRLQTVRRQMRRCVDAHFWQDALCVGADPGEALDVCHGPFENYYPEILLHRMR